MSHKNYFYIFIVVVFLCLSTQAYAIEIVVYNDLKESEEGYQLEIENARSYELPDTKIRFNITPGIKKRITNGNVSDFTLVRVFPTHKVKYQISCSKEASGRAVLTLIQVHDTKLPNGCKLERYGHWSKQTGMIWGTL